MTEKKIYEIMHMDRRVATISASGQCKIYYKSFMPYNLYLEESEDIDTLVNNITNFNVRLYDLMDFNQTFSSYNDMEGSNCQTMFGEHVDQREAAIKSVERVGLNQIKEVKKEIFNELPQFYEMFCKRLELLKSIE